MKRSLAPLMLLLLLALALPIDAEELRLKLEGQAAGMDPRLWTLSPAGLGGCLGLELDGLFTEALSLSLGASYLGFLSPPGEAGPVTALHAIHGVFSLSWLWELGRGSGLGPYAELGYGAGIARVSGEAEPRLGGQLRPALGILFKRNLSSALALSLRLGCFGLMESESPWFNLEFRAGLSFRLKAWGGGAASPSHEEALQELSSRSDMRLIGDAAAEGSVLAAEGQRLVIYGSFEAGKVNPTAAFEDQYPLILRYIRSLSGVGRIEVRGYVADDGGSDDGMALSTDRARLVKRLLDMELKERGIAVEARGMGEADPIGDNATAAGREQNRRIEIFIFGK